jgi:YD repeat-containing protein
VTYEPDIAGRLLSTTDPITGRTRFAYDAMDRLRRQTNAYDKYVEYEYFLGGELKAVSDELRQVTSFDRDELGRVSRTQLPQPGVYEFNHYDDVGNLVRFTDASGRIWTYDYDPMHRLIAASDGLGHTDRWNYVNGLLDNEVDANNRVTRYQYDAAAQLVAATTPSGATTRFSYDAAGRTSSITDPLGRRTEFEYDAEGKTRFVTDPAGGVVEYRYNPRRMLETIVSPTGGATNYTYDALGRLETVRDPAGVLTAYAYDVPLRRASVSVGGVTTFNFFDNVGRLWQSETPAAGA